jgi:chemotaxis protein MotB
MYVRSRTCELPSNWALSAAPHSVVQYLISKGVSPQHLAAAGFAGIPAARSRRHQDALTGATRRIELKLTER